MHNVAYLFIRIGILSALALGVSGCSLKQVNNTISEWSEKRHWQPKPMRNQIFYNTPTAKMPPNLQVTEDIVPGHRYEGYGQPYNYYESTSYPVANEHDDDSYGAGFEAGCDNMSSAMGAGSMRLITPKVDGYRLVNDQWYLRGYQDASSICTFQLDWETH
tara:strand:+ start:433 stop:915 length:483 start_codon:yes stop_codon:yes gene_type:complete